MNNKYFIITIDTEADNQWDVEHECTTENAKYLPRFQELSEKYNFKPVYLTTYEMALDDYFVTSFKEKQQKKLCEIGMHLHAWNNPPTYKLDSKTKERAYLIEYPKEIMSKKIEELDLLLNSRFGIKPISHRAGRWAMNADYFELLEKNGYKIDCSITPHINWINSLGETGIPGSDYSKEKYKLSFKQNILEVPVTIKKIRLLSIKNKKFKDLLKAIYRLIVGKYQWVRPGNNYGLKGIKKVIDKCNKKSEYIMFMIHSSELMPGGSPNFKTNEDIEKLYNDIEKIFSYLKEKGYIGITLRDFYEIKNRI